MAASSLLAYSFSKKPPRMTLRKLAPFATMILLVAHWAAQAHNPQDQLNEAAKPAPRSESAGYALLESVEVIGKRSDLLDQAPAASFGITSGQEIRSRPVSRRGEVLEFIPGLVVTQHAGGGKANQYFMRGFNLDHGTDFAVSIDSMPMNMRTHAHGQGYADINSLIPELVQSLHYTKGTYAARNGDLSSAGSADFNLYDYLPRGFATFEYGAYNYARTAVGHTLTLGDGNNPGKLTLAGEYNYYEGPWELPEYFNRANGFARYFKGTEEDHFSLTLMGYNGRWQSSDQVPLRSIQSGQIGRFGNLDPTNGGSSERHSLQLHAQTQDGENVTQLNLYGVYYSLGLFSNFTGEQFEQSEHRSVLGGNVSRTWNGLSVLGRESSLTLGIQTRTDLIRGIGLYDTTSRQRTNVQRLDNVTQSDVGIFAENTIKWTPWLRTITGLRADTLYFKGTSLTGNANQTGDELHGIISPKFSAIIGPFRKTEFYANFGTGFHSNDARGVVDKTNPADPLPRSVGAELGIRSNAIPTLTTTATLWWLRSESELVYIGDAGTNEAGPGSSRHGLELNAYWTPCEYFSMDAEFSLSHARFTNSPGASYVPNNVPLMFSGGFLLGANGEKTGWFSGTRIRTFGPRPLTDDNRVKSRPLCSVNTNIGYRGKNWEAALECLNLLDRKDNDIEYFYSRAGTPTPPEERHIHPVEPRMLRARFTVHW